ncbi:MAG TPA: GAF and ANTAR domain-containing protein [Actinocrinis sp.]
MAKQQINPTVQAAPTVQLLRLLAESPELDGFLTAIVRLAAQAVPAAAACGLTVCRDGQAFTAAGSDAFAAQIDEIQYEFDQGPCLEAIRTGKAIEIDDLAGDERWELFRPRALAHGAASSLSYPLAVNGQVVAALNLYATRRDAFGPTDRAIAQTISEHCTAALAVILRQAEQELVQQQLDDAMRSRSVIDQAIGILMAQRRCTAGQAFEVLRQASQHRNRKLRQVATDIIVNVTGQPPQAPTGFRTRPPGDANDAQQ